MNTNEEIKWKDCWKKSVKVQYTEITETVEIETREGKLFGYKGKDVLLKGVKGEIYPCKKDIFDATYTLIEPSSEEKIISDIAKRIFKDIEQNTDLIDILKFKTGGALSDWKQFKNKYKVD